jgi:predicted DNA-binding transcriptional regulator YafY
MYNQHRLYRVFQLIKELQSGENKSCNYLAKTMKVTVRSVYRYLELLEQVGLKVEKDKYGKFFLTNDINSILQNENNQTT